MHQAAVNLCPCLLQLSFEEESGSPRSLDCTGRERKRAARTKSNNQTRAEWRSKLRMGSPGRQGSYPQGPAQGLGPSRLPSKYQISREEGGREDGRREGREKGKEVKVWGVRGTLRTLRDSPQSQHRLGSFSTPYFSSIVTQKISGPRRNPILSMTVGGECLRPKVLWVTDEKNKRDVSLMSPPSAPVKLHSRPGLCRNKG